MKRTCVIVMALTVVGLIAWAFATRVSAGGQQPPPLTQPVQAPAATKVGVVNMGQIYAQYERVKVFKADMEASAKPFKDKKDACERCVKEWQTILSRPDNQLTKEQKEVIGPKAIVDARRQLEDLDAEFKKVIGKKLEDQMVQLNREINERIKAYAGSMGYHLILAYGEPEVELPPLMKFRRTMTVIDGGGVTIAYAYPGLDISLEIVRSLNTSYQSSRPNMPTGIGGQPK